MDSGISPAGTYKTRFFKKDLAEGFFYGLLNGT